MCSCSAIEVPLERGADLRSRTVEEDALVALGDVERLADLPRVAALDVAHRDHDALRRRKLVDGGEHDLERLAVGERLLGEALPVAGIGPPMPGEGIAGAAEAL